MDYENSSKFTMKDIILQILFIVLFVFILMWLFPTKGFVTSYVDDKVQPIYDRFFNENIQTMKDAAKSYYTLPRLPQNVGDKTKMTLNEMLEKKLLLEFRDSNNNLCDVDKSYVEVQKYDDEYRMKINLKCTDKEDYIIEYMGCYDYCTTTICEKEVAPISKDYLCEYMAVTNGKWGSWGPWSDWSTTRVEKSDYREIEIKTQRTQTGTITVEDGKETVKTDYKTDTSYSCPNGGTLNGKICKMTKTYSSDAAATTKYSCPNGGKISGTNCIVDKNGTYTAAITTTYTCANGTVSGSSCIQNGYYTAASKTIETTVGGWYDTAVDGYSCGKTREVETCDNCGTYKTQWYCTYTSTRKEYSCPKGGTLDGDICRVTNTTGAVATNKYSCPKGGTLDGTNCRVTETTTYAASTTKSYSCPKGGTLKGTKCYLDKDASYNAKENTNYTCPEGYTKSGDGTSTVCSKEIPKYKTEPVYKTLTYYRYRTRKYLSGDRDYKWSSCYGDSSLASKGYTMTGKKKEAISK